MEIYEVAHIETNEKRIAKVIRKSKLKELKNLDLVNELWQYKKIVI